MRKTQKRISCPPFSVPHGNTRSSATMMMVIMMIALEMIRIFTYKSVERKKSAVRCRPRNTPGEALQQWDGNKINTYIERPSFRCVHATPRPFPVRVGTKKAPRNFAWLFWSSADWRCRVWWADCELSRKIDAVRVIEKWFAVKVKGYAAAGCVRRFDDERLDFCSEFAAKRRNRTWAWVGALQWLLRKIGRK